MASFEFELLELCLFALSVLNFKLRSLEFELIYFLFGIDVALKVLHFMSIKERQSVYIWNFLNKKGGEGGRARERTNIN